jgi:hypothetical protein
MKGTIIGTDLVEYNGDVKILEINTNTTIYNDGADLLDYDALFETLITNNITELHFIYNETDAYLPLQEPFRFKNILEQKCSDNNISFFEYQVPANSVTVPYIEDANNKFILRQSYDTTALVDETYCGDKFGFCDLMRDSMYLPKTKIVSDTVTLDTFDEVDTTDLSNPNTIIKYRYPEYNLSLYPELHTLPTQDALVELKSTIPSNYFLQEYLFSNDNLVEGRNSVIRSIDIFYGPNLDVINMGGYKTSTYLPLDFAPTEFVSGSTTKLNQKSRYKYITKDFKDNTQNFHTDEDSKILMQNGTLETVNTIELGQYIRSVEFEDLNGNNASKFEQGKIDVFGWNGNLEKSNETLSSVSSSLVNMNSTSVDALFVRITTADGKSWIDSPSCKYYIEESGSTSTKFERVNNLYIGDKLVITDKDTQLLRTLEITGLEMEESQMKIYTLDFEPSDLFLVDINGDGGDFSIMHNSCWCPWYYCGYWCNYWGCNGCPGTCFIGETKINTPNGLVRIDEIKIGDEVISYDIKTGNNVVGIVGGLFEKDYNNDLVIINGYKTNATLGHAFAVKDLDGNIKWAAYDPSVDAEYHTGLEVIKLVEKEHQIYLNNEWVMIDKIELESYTGKVYNISVNDVQNYFAENILVHNLHVKKG